MLAVLFTARRILSRRAAWMAAAVLASSWGYFMSSQFVTLDMALTAFLTLALCAFLLAQDARASPADNRRWMLVAWALCALAVLTKGVIGVVLPALAVATYVVLRRDVALLRRLHIGKGAVVVLLIAAPWFVLAEARNPGFAEFFFVREHLQRFTQPLHRRPGAWWYFIPIAMAFLMPWLPAIVAALARRARAAGARARAGVRRADLLLVLGRRDPRVLQRVVVEAPRVHPAGDGRRGARGRRAARGPLARVTTRITAWTLIARRDHVWRRSRCPRRDSDRGAVGQAGVRRAPGGSSSARWCSRPAVAPRCGCCARTAHARARRAGRGEHRGVAGRHGARVQVDGYFSAHRLIERVTARDRGTAVPAGAPVLQRRHVRSLGDRSISAARSRSSASEGELAWGIAADPRRISSTISAEFEARWRASDAAYAIMRGETYAAAGRHRLSDATCSTATAGASS